MWLVYLRFDDRSQVKTYHIRTSSKSDVRALLELARKHGLTPTEKLVEYAAFVVSGTIKLRNMWYQTFISISTRSSLQSGKKLTACYHPNNKLAIRRDLS